MKRVLVALCILVVSIAVSGCPGGRSNDNNKATKLTGPVMKGDVAPDFELNGVNSKPFRLSVDGKGKFVLIAFYASWCHSCREEIPFLNRLNRQLGSKGLMVLGVNAGDKELRAKKDIRRLGIRYPIVIDDAHVTERQYGLLGLPEVFIIGPDRTVLFAGTSPPPMNNILDLIRKQRKPS